MKKYKVLIIEDDVDLATLTARFLQSFEFDCQVLHSAKNAPSEILQQNPDLVLLDVMLPDGDGLDICREVQTSFFGKIIMLTACTDLIDQVLGLELGADDYIPKPVEPRLLLAKCRAVLRRDESVMKTADNQSNEEEFFCCGNIEINILRREVYYDGKLQYFTTPEYDLLILLVSRRGEVVSRDDISQQLRGIEYDGQSRQIDINISLIRQKIDDKASNTSLIKTIRSKGYIFVG
jgi:two-component system response regulator RstA